MTDLHESMLKSVWKMIEEPREEEEEVVCPECKGKGEDTYGEQCPECAGEGKLTIDSDTRRSDIVWGSDNWGEEDEEDLTIDDEVDDDEQSPDPVENPEAEDVDPDEPEDPDRAGIIRTVNNAHMVYKRANEEGTYDELWIYNINDKVKDELDIRRAILAGTDIEPGRTKSEDGSQTYDMWTAGNAQLLLIQGLPN